MTPIASQVGPRLAWALLAFGKIKNLAPTVLIEVCVLAALYYGAARLGLLLSFENTNASPVWPPSGIAFAAVLLRGRRIWPGVLLGALLANVAVFAANQAAGMGAIVVISWCIAAGNTMEAVAASYFLQCWAGTQRPLDRAQDVFRLAVVAVFACMVSCTTGATTLCVSGLAPWQLYGTIWFTWWLGDVAGILVVAPTLLAWRAPWQNWRLRRVAEAVLLLMSLMLGGQVVFGGLMHVGAPLAYLLIPIIVWAAFRFGQAGVALASMLLSGIAVWGTIHDMGPFGGRSLHESLLLLQIFVATVTVTGLILAAVLTERAAANQAEQAAREDLARHASQLEAANKELEAFAYSVSHDLRAPLRSVEGFSQALAEDYAEQIDDAGRDMLQRVRAASQRMAQLIDDMLVLSRLTRTEMRRERVDLSALAQAIATELRRRAPERDVEFVIADGLFVEGDRGLLRVACENLLENAWKFTGKTPVARIEVGATIEASRTCYFVRDNGAGFDMAYADKLFGAFQRLHGTNEFPGTGIGLATVQRVLHRHGGQAWAEGRVGQGATIYFAL